MAHPFPGDPLGRAWIEVSGANPTLVAQYRSALVAFLAYDHNRYARLVGTGFVVCGQPDMALVMSARHVLVEGVVQVQRPVPTHVPSTPFVPKHSTTPSLQPRHLRVLWMGQKAAGLLDALYASYNSSSDLALCLIAPQKKGAHAPFAPVSIPLHTATPCVGDIVRMVSSDKMDVTEIAPPERVDGLGHTLRLFRRVSIRVGTVTAVYPSGFRQFAWPCFTTSIPAEPGMSGGFVFLPNENTTVAACGVVTADTSAEEARTNQMLAGESIIACTWPALALPIPEKFGGGEPPSKRTFLEMVRMGNIPEPLGGVSHFDIVSRAEGGTVLRIRKK